MTIRLSIIVIERVRIGRLSLTIDDLSQLKPSAILLRLQVIFLMLTEARGRSIQRSTTRRIRHRLRIEITSRGQCTRFPQGRSHSSRRERSSTSILGSSKSTTPSRWRTTISYIVIVVRDRRRSKVVITRVVAQSGGAIVGEALRQQGRRRRRPSEASSRKSR